MSSIKLSTTKLTTNKIMKNNIFFLDNIWSTELDFITINRRNLVVVSISSSPYQNISSANDDYNDTTFYGNSISNEHVDADDKSNNNNNNKVFYGESIEDRGGMEDEEEDIPYSKSTFFEVPEIVGVKEDDDYKNEFTSQSSSTSSSSSSSSSSSTSFSTISSTLTTVRSTVSTPRMRMKGRLNKNGRRNKGGKSSENRSSQQSRSEEYDQSFERITTLPRSNSEELGVGRNRLPTANKDSNIHIVKPEKLPEIIPSTPISSNSKIIEIKPKKAKREAELLSNEELQVDIEPEYLISPPATNLNPRNSLPRLDGFSGMLQTFFGIEREIDVKVFNSPPSAEFINLVIALMVWCVRYPALFWNTTKSFGTIFSIQMIASALDVIFSYVGVSNLYKLQIYSESAPVEYPGLILNGTVTLALYLLSSLLVLTSSMVMYLYGHGRLASKMRDRALISLKSNDTWIYFAHCASLCFVLALSVAKAPLLNDLSATYRNNLHCPTFLSGELSFHCFFFFVKIVCFFGLLVSLPST